MKLSSTTSAVIEGLRRQSARAAARMAPLSLFVALAAMSAPTGAHRGDVTISLTAPAGSAVDVDGTQVATVGPHGAAQIQVSPERHRLEIRRGQDVLDQLDVQFGPGSRISLTLGQKGGR